ncbi:hypothetical protein HDU78_001367 [Chytriomyces hyalinus]|nr:hypothetical protein HDU78_001367 [Chytriomyces hyalinus]
MAPQQQPAANNSNSSNSHNNNGPIDWTLGVKIFEPPAVSLVKVAIYSLGALLNVWILLALAYARRHERMVRVRLDRTMVFIVSMCLLWSIGAPTRFILTAQSGPDLVEMIALFDAPFASSVAVLIFGGNLLLALERYFMIKRNIPIETKNFYFYAIITAMGFLCCIVVGVFIKIQPSIRNPNAPTTAPSADGYMPMTEPQATIWTIAMGVAFVSTLIGVSSLYSWTYKQSSEMLRMALADASMKAFQTAADMRSDQSFTHSSSEPAQIASASSSTNNSIPYLPHPSNQHNGHDEEEWEMRTLSHLPNHHQTSSSCPNDTGDEDASVDIPYNELSGPSVHYPKSSVSVTGTFTAAGAATKATTTATTTVIEDPLEALERLEEAHLRAERKILLSCILMTSTLFLCYAPTILYEFSTRTQLWPNPRDPRYTTFYCVAAISLSFDVVLSPLLILYFRKDFREALILWKWRKEDEEFVGRGAGGGELRRPGEAAPYQAPPPRIRKPVTKHGAQLKLWDAPPLPQAADMGAPGTAKNARF